MGVYAEFHSLASKLQAKFSKSGLAQMEVFTQRQIDHHLQSSSKETIPDAERTDFVSKLLEMHKAQPDKISLENVFMACLTNVGAGSDTTSISLSAILYYLIKSPDKYKKAGFLPIENLCNQKANRPKLRDEIDESYSSGEASRPMTYQQSQRLPYLQACIKEGLRLHPATGLPLARVVPKGGAQICGRFFPEGVCPSLVRCSSPSFAVASFVSTFHPLTMTFFLGDADNRGRKRLGHESKSNRFRSRCR